MSDGVTGNTSDFGSEESRFEPWSDNYKRKVVCEGTKVPSFIEKTMIAEKHIRKLAEAELAGTDRFLVEVQVKSGNRIMVFIDSDTEVSIDNCIALSRHLEGQLDREREDFELLVSSAGLDHAFSQLRQYRKYMNRPVEIQPLEGARFTAILCGISEGEITFRKLIKKHKNKAAEPGEVQSLPLSGIKETKPAIQFGK